MPKTTVSHIREYWENQAKQHQTSHVASWGDHWAIDLEIEAIAKHIRAGQTVLDVGCANGYSTFRQYEKQPGATFTGVDYADTMIHYARQTKQEKGVGKAIEFQTGDILALPFDDRRFDVTYTTRVLINLPTWEQQQQGIAECLRVTKPGGMVVLSEGFWEPLCLLNSMRQLLGLSPPLAEHDFNRYLKKQKLESWLNERRIAWSADEFSSLYYLGSRVLREVMLDTLPPYGDYNSPVNELFFNIEKQYSGGGFGIQQAYVLTKP